ncbi:MAG: hypothetical protein ABI051_13445 [Vicinamibacterales bacterium]
MTRKSLLLAVVWVASLLVVGVWAQGTATAPQDRARGREIPLGVPVGPVITGENIGFQQISAMPRAGKIYGKFMIKVDGQWLELASPGGSLVPITR